MSVDTIENILRVHEAGGAPTSVIETLRLLREEEDTNAAGGYRPEVLAAKNADARRQRAVAIAEEIGKLQAEAAAEDAAAMDVHVRADHERVTATNGHEAIDLDRLRMATSPAEISLLWQDAKAHSVDGAKRAWGYIEPRLKQMAAKEAREHRIGTGPTAFNLLCRVQVEMRELMRRTPDRTQLSEAAQLRQREIRRKALGACAVLGLDKMVEQAAKQAAIPAAPKSMTVSGKFFDQFGKRGREN